MANLEVSSLAAQKLDELSRQTQRSVDDVLLWLLDTYGNMIPSTEETETKNEVWTDEEVSELLQPKQPLTGRQIVEKHLASGVIGSWSDDGIVDGAQWVEEQRAKRRDKYQW